MADQASIEPPSESGLVASARPETVAIQEPIGIPEAGLTNSAPSSGELAAETLLRLQAVTDAALTHLPLDELERNLLYRIRELLGSDIAMILLCSEQNDCLMLHAISSVTSGFENLDDRRIRIPVGRGVGGHIARARQPLIFGDLSEVEVLNPALKENNICSLVGAPLLLQERVIGVIYVGKTSIGGFNEEDARLLQLVAERFALAIERSRLYSEVREQEKRKSAILEAALDCIVITDENGLVTEFNPAAERTFGYSREEAIGQSLFDLIIPHRLREKHQEGLHRFLTRRGASIIGRRIEITGMRADGSEFPLELAIAVSDAGGKVSYASYLRDITESKQVEAEREQLLERERQARAEAEAANRSKDEFLSILSHELRTPLTPMMGWVELLLAGKLNEEMSQEALQAILRNIKTQTRLVEDLLDISRIVAGKPELKFGDVELEPIVRETLDSIRPSAEDKRITILTLFEPDIGPINGDPHRLQQVVLNLVSNAIKFTPPGGWVKVSLTKTETHAVLQVRDDGEGINPEFLPFVFDRLRQADASPTRKHGGLGVGLAIVQHLVELHHGTVQAASPGPGLGATFTVSLPLRDTFASYPDPRDE